MRYVGLILTLAAFFGVGLTWGADQPTLEELAAGIERVRNGPDGERVVAGHISRKLAVSVEALRTQRAQTALGWGELLIASLLCKDKKLTVEQVAAELRSGATWADIARRHNVSLDPVIKEVQQSQQAMERRDEDRAPPRSESPSTQGTTRPGPSTPSGPTTVVPGGMGSGRRY